MKKLIFFSVFAIVALIFEFYFGFATGVGFILQVILLAFGCAIFVRILRKKYSLSWRKQVMRYAIVIAGVIGIGISLFLSFIQYQHSFPGKTYDITLSHSGGQQVVFLQMAHIATPAFYAEKGTQLHSYSNSGYTILMEGVRPGSPESQAAFDRALGFQFTPDLYKELSSIVGLTAQDNQSLYARVSSGSLKSVDLSIDEIVTMMGTGMTMTQSTPPATTILTPEIREIFSRLGDRDRQFTTWVLRGILSFSLKATSGLEDALMAGSYKSLFDAILTGRNVRIAEYIQSHPQENIVVVYGALHFNGVYELLQKSDPTWHTVSTKEATPYR